MEQGDRPNKISSTIWRTVAMRWRQSRCAGGSPAGVAGPLLPTRALALCVLGYTVAPCTFGLVRPHDALKSENIRLPFVLPGRHIAQGANFLASAVGVGNSSILLATDPYDGGDGVSLSMVDLSSNTTLVLDRGVNVSLPVDVAVW